MANSTEYYCAGFYWHDNEPENQLPRFIKEGIWENGFDDKLQEKVNSVAVGSRIAAKTTYTRKENGKTISVLEVHCLGTVTDNPQNGKILKVKWDKDFKPIKIDGAGAYRSTLSRVHDKRKIDVIFGKTRRKQDEIETAKAEDLKDSYPLNKILYGPPGTGKTYSSIRKAVAIIDGIKEEALDNYYRSRTDLKERYDELVGLGQIVFCTFHQSMSYEEFVEGIKPVLEEEDTEEQLEGEADTQLSYELVDGIFKRLCTYAKYDYYKSSFDTTSAQISRSEFFNIAYDQFLATVEQSLDKTGEFPVKTKTGAKLFITSITRKLNLKIRHERGTKQKIYTISKARLLKLFNHFKHINDITSIQRDIRAVIGGANSTAYWAILAVVYDWYEKAREKGLIGKEFKREKNYETIKQTVESFSITNQKVNDTAPEKYLIIIDEINRGNISQILGELITLLEPDKRLGCSEALEVTLPYSREKFGVPPNVYILGTMNTADRSVEALDTALRRRFSFEEMMPRPALLDAARLYFDFWSTYPVLGWDEPWPSSEREFFELFTGKRAGSESQYQKLDNIETIDEWLPAIDSGSFVTFGRRDFIIRLLLKLNERLTIILGRDHCIGHSFFMRTYSWKDLENTFYDNIFPLLQEYFYNDYGKMGLVIGFGFIKSTTATSDVFAQCDYDADIYDEKKVFELVDYRAANSNYVLDFKGRSHQMNFKKAVNLLMDNAI
jgi:5-methylcytosine-specific restriction endonuclease McrBC GTP-binding regulatory subunit McrB